MTDPALEILFEQFNHYSGRKLLVADEHLDCQSLLQLKSIADLHILTNRKDIHQCATSAGISCTFNDMVLSAQSGPFSLIGYRVSKEKAMVHHVINQAARHLSAQGTLLLAGYKDEGIKTYISKTELYVGCKAQVTRGERQLQLAAFTPTLLSDALDDRQYGSLQLIGEIADLKLFSKPGQYGWNKIDEGSALLADCLQTLMGADIASSSSVLDLGCGYGYLSLRAWQLGLRQITATDNNAAAIASCQHNFSANNITGEVIADDCAASISQQFDLVLCNPPFHRGFDTEQALTEKFVTSAAHHLKKNGAALFVVNQFIGLEAAAAARFQAIETLHKDKRFKVLRLSC